MTSIVRASLRSTRQDDVLVVQLTRDDRYNALDRSTLIALGRILERERAQGGALVLAGAGPLFSVGPDIAELAALDAATAADFSRLAHQVVSA
jgi:enoyl-CoA hydratase/carnithine racemase